MTTITLTSDYGYNQYSAKNIDTGTVIDATDATFIEDNNSGDGPANPYPIAIRESADVTLMGGTVLGNVDQITDREVVYGYDPGNSAAIRAEETPDLLVRDWRIDDAWDGIRMSWNSRNFIIDDVWITDVRDDAVENDKLNSGTIHDSLFDGVMNGISLDPSSSSPVDGSDESVTIDGVLMRMKTYLSDGEVTHGTPIKVDKSLPLPDLHITNSVFAIEDVSHNGIDRLAVAWSNVVESSGNVFLNLSDKPLPADYPEPPSGWTVLQGQAARDYWQEARDSWVESHSDGTVSPDPTPVPDDPTPVPGDTEDATFGGVDYKGSDADETIVGNAGDNEINAAAGDDIIHGAAGNDILRSDDGADQLWGDAGDDTLFYKNLSDSRARSGVDIIRDFTQGEDKLDLSRIDANRNADGDQAFVITDGAPGAGELSVRFDAGTGNTVIEANVDDEVLPELTILLAGEHDLTASDFTL